MQPAERIVLLFASMNSDVAYSSVLLTHLDLAHRSTYTGVVAVYARALLFIGYLVQAFPDLAMRLRILTPRGQVGL